MKGGYWLFLENYVHVSLKAGEILFYNSYSGQVFRRQWGEGERKFFQRLLRPDAMRTAEIPELDELEPSLAEFLRRLREAFIADWIPRSLAGGRPVQLYPRVKVMKDDRRLLTSGERIPGDQAAGRIASVYAYINDDCRLGCRMCGDAYRQFPCCSAKPGGRRTLDLATLSNFIAPAQRNDRFMLHVLGGNILAHPDVLDWSRSGTPDAGNVVYYLHYRNAALAPAALRNLLQSGGSVRLLADFPLNPNDIEVIRESFSAAERGALDCVVSSDSDFEAAERLAAQFPRCKTRIRLYYNGQNLDFFQENVFIRAEDIGENRPSMRDIYMRSVINPGYFGELVIDAGGGVRARAGGPLLGRIGEISIMEAAYREMRRNSAWRRLRRHVNPCRQCVYELLCPPVSGYDDAIGRHNLCHIWKPSQNNPAAEPIKTPPLRPN